MRIRRLLSRPEKIIPFLIACFVGAGFAAAHAATESASTVVRWGSILFNASEIGISNVVAVDSGYEHSLALKNDGTVVCFGSGCHAPMQNAPTGITDFVAVSSSGVSHSLGLRSDGTVVAWGDNYFGETSVPAGLTGVIAVKAANRQSMVLKSDGTVLSWGQFGTNVPAGLSGVAAIDANQVENYFHALALKADGTVVAWGANHYGENNVPAGLSNVIAVACGGYHNLALKSDGTVVGWGGQDSSVATPPAGLANVVAIAAGTWHNLALKADGTVVGWKGSTVPSWVFGSGVGDASVVPAGLSNVVAISAGFRHSIALTRDIAPIIVEPLWGADILEEQTYQFVAWATGTEPFTYQWQKDGEDLPEETDWILKVVHAGFEDAGVYTVRVSNSIGSVTSEGATLNVLPFLDIVSHPENAIVYEGTSASFSVGARGTEPLHFQWRRNNVDVPGATNSTWLIESVQLSDASTNITAVVSNAAGVQISHRAKLTVLSNIYPTIVAQPQPQSVFIGARVAFRVRATGRPVLSYQWQKDGSDLTGASSAELVIANVQAADAGVYRVRISNDAGNITSQDAALEVSAWTFPSRPAGTVVSLGGPIVPPGLTNAIAVAASSRHSVALREDGTVAAWGGRQAEIWGTTNVPVGLSNVVAISAGPHSTIALRADGTVIGWGFFPSPIADVFGIVAISEGIDLDSHTLALRVDGRVVNLPDGSVVNGIGNAIGVSHDLQENLIWRADGTVFAWGFFGNVFASLNNVIQVAAGFGGYLALLDDGTVHAWGGSVPEGLSNVKAISLNGFHALALKQDGTAVSWGGEAPSADGVSNVVAISAGEKHSLLITTNPPPPELAAAADGNNQILLTAPVSVSGYVLEASDNLNSSYVRATAAGETNNGTLVIPNTGGVRFFRFRRQ